MKKSTLLKSTTLIVLALSTPSFAQPVEIISLYDAFGHEDPTLEHDWGFSVVVRFGGKTILFDSGNSPDRLRRNAEALGIDFREIDFAILSHRHADHASGFDYVLEVKPGLDLYLPADDGLGFRYKVQFSDNSEDLLESLPPEQRYFKGRKGPGTHDPGDRFWKARSHFVTENQEIVPGVFVIATERTDWDLPELSLALPYGSGVTIVTGCSHSGIEQIAAATKEYLNRDVTAIVGGLHLVNQPPERIRKLAKRLTTRGVREIAPAHCTGHRAFKILREDFGKDYRFLGLGSKIRLSSQ